MMPILKWDVDYPNRGIYFPEVNIVVINPHQSQASFFVSMLHEMGHWALFRLGQSDAVHTLNCAWDMLDYVLSNKKWFKKLESH